VKPILAVVLGAAGALAGAAAHAQMAPARELHFAFDLGVTGGGDKLATANFRDGTSESIRAGGLVQFGAGLLWQPAGGPVAMQVTYNYHIDEVNAANGTLRFSRYPVEVLGYYTGLPGWRFGAGPRFVFSPRLKVDVPGDNTQVAFEDTVGAVFEAGYRVAPYAWANLRLTAETYRIKSINGTAVAAGSDVSGNSIGANVVLFF
jgi:hypothetical protein